MLFLHRTPTGHLGSHVAAGAHPGQRRGPARAVAASPQHRRVGVEHLGTTEHVTAARIAQDQPVAENQRQPPVESQPAVVVVERPQPRGHGRSADMHDESRRGFGQWAAGNAAHVERARARPRVGGDQCVAAMDGVAGDAAQVERHPRYRSQHGVRLAAALQAADHHRSRAFGAEQVKLVAARQRARRERPGDHRARAGDGERPIDPEPQAPGGLGSGQPRQDAVEGGA